MLIGNVNNVGASDGLKKKKKTASGGDFSAHLKTSEPTKNSSVSPVSATNPLFMLQEIDADENPKQQAINHGHDVLSQLDEIKLSLLTGNTTQSLLNSLDERIKNWRSDISDPKLQKIIDDIELRAAIELAKLQLD